MTCEVCAREATRLWGMDLTPLCDSHYEQAERNYEAAADEPRTPA